MHKHIKKFINTILRSQSLAYSTSPAPSLCPTMIEMEFQGLKYLKLFPADERYSCEILDSNIILKEDCIIWSDCEDKTELEDGDTGTLVCASKLRWRSIFGYMGEKNYW